MLKPALLAATVVLSLPSLAAAVPLLDAPKDFIASYTGPQNGDLDVLSSEVFLANGVFDFTARVSGTIGTTAGGFYVFGVNRGSGTARFASLGLNNVLFDAVVIVNNNLTASVRDLLTNTTTNLSPSAIAFKRTSLSALVNASLLPSTGFAFADYTYNLWPRSPGAGNAFISDFAPDNANAQVTAVPEPATWALMIGGFGAVGAVARRRRGGAALV